MLSCEGFLHAAYINQEHKHYFFVKFRFQRDGYDFTGVNSLQLSYGSN